jgi:hypothetical protein
VRAKYLAKDWFADLRDLDAEELVAVQEALHTDPWLGATPQERRQFVARLKRLVPYADWTARGLAAWALFYPEPYWLVIALCAALSLAGVGLHLFSRGYLRIEFANEKTKDPRPDIGGLVWLPALMLLLRAMIDFSFVDRAMLVVSSAALSAVAAVALCWHIAAWRRSFLRVFCVFLCAWTYTYGAVAEADVLFDNNRPVVFPTKVVKLKISRGSKHTSYDVTVEPWGPEHVNDEINVSRSYYAQLHVGDRACIYQGPGWLGIRWYSLGDC